MVCGPAVKGAMHRSLQRVAVGEVEPEHRLVQVGLQVSAQAIVPRPCDAAVKAAARSDATAERVLLRSRQAPQPQRDLRLMCGVASLLLLYPFELSAIYSLRRRDPRARRGREEETQKRRHRIFIGDDEVGVARICVVSWHTATPSKIGDDEVGVAPDYLREIISVWRMHSS